MVYLLTIYVPARLCTRKLFKRLKPFTKDRARKMTLQNVDQNMPLIADGVYQLSIENFGKYFMFELNVTLSERETVTDASFDTILRLIPKRTIIESIIDTSREYYTNWTGRDRIEDPSVENAELTHENDVDAYDGMFDLTGPSRSRTFQFTLTDENSRDVPKDMSSIETQTDHIGNIPEEFVLSESDVDYGYCTDDDMEKYDFYHRQSIIYHNPHLVNDNPVRYKERLTRFESILSQFCEGFLENTSSIYRDGWRLSFH